MAEAGQLRVCIIGAGVSGLSACRYLLKLGVRPTVFESNSDVGGVWRTNSVGITKLQTPSRIYQFSDFPWPDDTPVLPTASQVIDYLQAYAHQFGVIDCVRFHSTVYHVCPGDSGGPPWKVHVKEDNMTSQQVYEFDYVILCLGRYGDVPNLPSFPPGKGPEVFKGRVMHSVEYCGLDAKQGVQLLSGNNVVVVGFSKSALDIAAEVVLANQGSEGKPCTLLFRRTHWLVTEWKAFGISLSYLFGTRFSEMLVSNKPEQGFLLNLLSLFFWPLRWSISKLVELYLRRSFPLSKYGLVPNISFEEQLASCKISMIPDNFFSYVEEGRLKLCKSPNWHYTEKGICLDNGDELEADVVISCTGFQAETKLKSILPSGLSQALQGPDGVVPLYRGIIHPRIPGLAFLGYQEVFSNITSSEMGARWLARLICGRFKLPDTQTMQKSAESWLEFMKRSSPYYERCCVSTIKIWHADQLCRDMGWNPRRKRGWLQDMFSPYCNLDYID